jgi:hypothetical protein
MRRRIKRAAEAALLATVSNMHWTPDKEKGAASAAPSPRRFGRPQITPNTSNTMDEACQQKWRRLHRPLRKCCSASAGTHPRKQTAPDSSRAPAGVSVYLVTPSTSATDQLQSSLAGGNSEQVGIDGDGGAVLPPELDAALDPDTAPDP